MHGWSYGIVCTIIINVTIKFTFTRNVDTLILLVLWYPDQLLIIRMHKAMELYVQ